MAKPSDDQFTFISVFLATRDRVSVVADQADGGPPGTQLFWNQGKLWGQNDVAFTPLFSFGIPMVETTVVGVGGEWRSYLPGRTPEDLDGNLDPGPEGPLAKGQIRGGRSIDGRLYAVGMSRQAYERDEQLNWRHIDADLKPTSAGVYGLNAIDGFSQKEIYSAGLDGEIWRYTGARWFQVPSPTNLMLNAVRVVGEEVFIAGNSGVLLRGRMGVFQVAAIAPGEETLEDIEVLNGTVYCASLKNLYRFDGSALRVVDTKLGGITAGSLSAADGVLWSAGAKHLVMTEDGKKWTQIFLV